MAALDSEVIESIDEVNENQWNNIVSQTDQSTSFHRTGWLRAIEDGLEYEARHVVVRKKGNPVAICPNFVIPIVLPFDPPIDLTQVGLAQLSSVSLGFGGPVISADRDRSFERLFDTIEAMAGWTTIVHRLRILDPGHVQYAQKLRARGYRPVLSTCRHWLDLTDYQQITDEMEKERRNEIRTASQYEPEIVEEEVTRDAMREFYAEYRKTMERIGGRTLPLAFFNALADHFSEHIEIFTARVDGTSVGSHVYLRDEEQDSMHHFFSGVDEDHFEYSAPTVIHDYALRWGIENEYATYDFGETSSDYGDGLFKYKQKFGTQIEPVYEWERALAPIRWGAYRKALDVYS